MSFFNPVSFVADIVVSGFARQGAIEEWNRAHRPTPENIASARIALLRKFRPDLVGTAQERELLAASTRSTPAVATAITKELSMSMLGDIGRAIAPALGGWLGGYTTIGSAAGSAIGTQVAQLSAQRSGVAGPGMMQTMASLPRIAGALGGMAGTVVGATVLGARTVMRSAVTYCRRHPAWCSQIGGTAAIAAMIQGGQLPPIRRRRARGISPSEFRGFRKVHRVLSGFCAPRMRVRRAKR